MSNSHKHPIRMRIPHVDGLIVTLTPLKQIPIIHPQLISLSEIGRVKQRRSPIVTASDLLNSDLLSKVKNQDNSIVNDFLLESKDLAINSFKKQLKFPAIQSIRPLFNKKRRISSRGSTLNSLTRKFIHHKKYSHRTSLMVDKKVSITQIVRKLPKLKHKDEHWIKTVDNRNSNTNMKYDIQYFVNNYKEGIMNGKEACNELLKKGLQGRNEVCNKLYDETGKEINDIGKSNIIGKDKVFQIELIDKVLEVRSPKVLVAKARWFKQAEKGNYNSSKITQKTLKEILKEMQRKYKFGDRIYYEILTEYMGLLEYDPQHKASLRLSKETFIDFNLFFKNKHTEFIERICVAGGIPLHSTTIGIENYAEFNLLFKYCCASKEDYINLWIHYLDPGKNSFITQEERYRLLGKLSCKITDTEVDDSFGVSVDESLRKCECLDQENKLNVKKLKQCLLEGKIDVEIFNNEVKMKVPDYSI